MSLPDPPYPAKTKAKGWRFELDYEQVEQSDTWDLAAPEVRPWLLMMWLAAWKQAPCGSLPADEEILPAKFGMPSELWARHRRIMLRGWTEASDGRLYHETLTDRVLEMLSRRRSDADRQALSRAAKKAPKPKPDTQQSPAEVDEMSRVTPPEVRSESSTDHRPPNTDITETEVTPQAIAGASAGAGVHPCEAPSPYAAEPPAVPAPAPPPVRDPERPTVNEILGDLLPGEVAPNAVVPSNPIPGVAGLITRRLKARGIHDAQAGHPDFTALLAAGATAEEFDAFVDKAVGAAARPFPYLLTAVRDARLKAAARAKTMPRGPMPHAAGPPPGSYAERRASQLTVAAVLTGVQPPARAPAPIQPADEVIDGHTRLLT